MNDLMLTFSGVELSRLRNLVAAVGKEIALVPGMATTAESQTRRTALARCGHCWTSLPAPKAREKMAA